MKTAHQLVADLLEAVDTTKGNCIQLPKEDAVRIAELLVKVQFVGETPQYRDGKILFIPDGSETPSASRPLIYEKK